MLTLNVSQLVLQSNDFARAAEPHGLSLLLHGLTCFPARTGRNARDLETAGWLLFDEQSREALTS